MKIRNLISFVSLGLSLGATIPAFADPSFNTSPALNNAVQVLLASRDGDNEARGNGRDQADRRSNGDSGRQQNEGRRDERQGRFGYGFERRQEHDQRQPNNGNGRDRQQN